MRREDFYTRIFYHRALHSPALMKISRSFTLLAFVLIALVYSPCYAAPGVPNFRNAVLSSATSVWTTIDPDFSFGGAQPLAMYLKGTWNDVTGNLASTLTFTANVSPQGQFSVRRDGRGNGVRFQLVKDREYVFVFNYDGKNLTTYIDGEFVSAFTSWKESRGPPIELCENRYNSQFSFNCSRVALWDRALTHGEITM